MLEAAAVLLLFLSFALVHGAATGRFPVSGWKPGKGSVALLKVGALAAAAGGVACWSQVDNTTAALLVALSALSVAATLVVLLSPVFPRAMWALLIVWSLLVVLLLPLGGWRG
jgi:hypothetical protein